MCLEEKKYHIIVATGLVSIKDSLDPYTNLQYKITKTTLDNNEDYTL